MFVAYLRPILCGLACLAATLLNASAFAQGGTVRGYPAGAALQQTPYYRAYYPVQYGYAYPQPAASWSGIPQTAYYAPVPAAQAAARPTASYTLTPSGGVNAGSEAFAYYGQSTPLNYVPPTYAGYQTRMVQVPVTYYRPYTVYQPGVAVPTTCQRVATGTVCQPTTGHRWFSCLDWLFHKRQCGAPAAVPVAAAPVAAAPIATVPAVAPRAVCYGSTCVPQCGTPYYNTVPSNVVPGVAVPSITVPGTAVPGTAVPGTAVPGTAVPGTAVPGGIPGFLAPPATVPPPGTRIIVPGTSGTTSGDGADVIPRIAPGTSVSPPNSFPGTGSGFSPSGANYSRSIGGSDRGRTAATESPYEGPSLTRPAISEPSLSPRRSVRPVPDPAAGKSRESGRPSNRAPALITPGDRTADAGSGSNRADAWGVVPAKWPEKSRPISVGVGRGSVQPVSQYVPAPQEERWDDTLWQSAR